MQSLDLLILSLATWRLARMLAAEAGPGNILTKLRKRFPMGGVFDCIYCMSVYTAVAVLAAWLYLPAEIIYVTALSGGAMLMHRYTGGDHL